jgi:hypothetical protein
MNNPSPPSSQCVPKRQFTRTVEGSHHVQIGDIDATQGQDEEDGAKKYQQGNADIAYNVIEQRQCGSAPTCIEVGPLGRSLDSEAAHFRPRRRDRDTFAHPGIHLKVAPVAGCRSRTDLCGNEYFSPDVRQYEP